MAVAAFLAGLLLGLGLVVSQMINPAKVLGFLDLFGRWDPSLALVLAASVAVSALGFGIARRRARPLAAPAFRVPGPGAVEPRLLAGAALFGIGWGLVGLCPGPALAALVYGMWEVALFVAAMAAGMVLHAVFERRRGGGITPS